ncbi:uncharacterized protein LOC127010633 [Drosophila biarmipes]|uniref:uncharacterized protein LOC127010633 n=1 Tax=Drosophila biarmipes TaxID=125945 RepID=UPI0021CCE266|nr:uncharacterized protein LOC127010633 [Drosophila biarmipes]
MPQSKAQLQLMPCSPASSVNAPVTLRVLFALPGSTLRNSRIIRTFGGRQKTCQACPGPQKYLIGPHRIGPERGRCPKKIRNNRAAQQSISCAWNRFILQFDFDLDSSATVQQIQVQHAYGAEEKAEEKNGKKYCNLHLLQL